MMTATAVSREGLDLIKQFEGLKLNAYVCPAGKLTIGYGHVLLAGDGVLFGLSSERMAQRIRALDTGLEITEAQAELLLGQDVRRFARAVDVAVTEPLAQNQFDALCSLAFNIGTGHFTRSTLLKKLNAGDFKGAARQFDRWVHVDRKRLNGLVRRRAAERALFERRAVAAVTEPAAAGATLHDSDDSAVGVAPVILDDQGKPWWQSRTVLGVALALLPTLSKLAGVDYETAVAPYAGDIATLIGSAVAIYGRVAAKRRIG